MFSFVADKYQYELEELERIRFRVDRFLLMPKHEAWLRREAFVRQAFSSTMIENAGISQDELAGAERELSIQRPDVANYARALEFIDFMSGHKDLVIDELLIRQIHWLLLRAVRDDHYLPGEYRKTPNWIEDSGIRVYESPHALDVPALMREFVLAMRNEMHPILKAGLAHIHLVAIHPFVDGNGRTARLLATLVLQNGGWGFRNLLSLDHYYQRNRDEYISALSKTLGPKFRYSYEADPWLEFFCSSVLLEARRLERRLTEWQMTVDEVHRTLKPSGLSDRQIDGLIYAIRKGEITRRDYMEIAAISPLTATRDLAAMVAKGILEPHGASRSRTYRLKIRISPPQTSKPEAEGQQQKML